MRLPRAKLKRVPLLLLAVVAVLAICTSLTTYLTLNRPAHRSNPATAAAHTTAPNKQAEAVRKTVNAGLPVRLRIPKINVNAALDPIGLTPHGDLDTPKGPLNAAWYNQGPRPGDSGNAIINGHFGYKDHKPAVFDNLHLLQPGDNVYVQDEKGVTVTFLVRESRAFRPNQDATAVFRPSDGKAHLNLITCQGAWDKAQKSYTARLVVFTDRQDAPPQTSRPAR